MQFENVRIKCLFLDDDEIRTKNFISEVPSAETVKTAEECINKLKENDYDCVFLDHDLGGETYVSSKREDCGMEVVRWIKENLPKINLACETNIFGFTVVFFGPLYSELCLEPLKELINTPLFKLYAITKQASKYRGTRQNKKTGQTLRIFSLGAEAAS